MYNKDTFAKQFKNLIDGHGLTQREVAVRMNTTETTISRYVAGVRTPNIETAVELARVLGVSMDTLVGIEPPAAERRAPDLNILESCYKRATTEQREAVWSVLKGFGLLSQDQRVIIDAINAEEKVEAV